LEWTGKLEQVFAMDQKVWGEAFKAEAKKGHLTSNFYSLKFLDLPNI